MPPGNDRSDPPRQSLTALAQQMYRKNDTSKPRASSQPAGRLTAIAQAMYGTRETQEPRASSQPVGHLTALAQQMAARGELNTHSDDQQKPAAGRLTQLARAMQK